MYFNFLTLSDGTQYFFSEAERDDQSQDIMHIVVERWSRQRARYDVLYLRAPQMSIVKQAGFSDKEVADHMERVNWYQDNMWEWADDYGWMVRNDYRWCAGDVEPLLDNSIDAFLNHRLPYYRKDGSALILVQPDGHDDFRRWMNAEGIVWYYGVNAGFHFEEPCREAVPPQTLFHGTAMAYAESIEKRGLLHLFRSNVQMTDDMMKAWEFSELHSGKEELIYWIDSKKMHRDGMKFYRTQDGVWMTRHVPPQYLSRWDQGVIDDFIHRLNDGCLD